MSVLHRVVAFADHADLITLVSRGPVVVEGVGQLSVATDQMRGFEHDPGQRVGDTTALAVPLGQRHVDGAFLPVVHESGAPRHAVADHSAGGEHAVAVDRLDRKSTRLNSSHVAISYAVFCLKKKNIQAKE